MKISIKMFLMSVLLLSGIPASAKANLCSDAIIEAAENGSVDEIKALEADEVNCYSRFGGTPLMLAIRYNTLEAVEALIEAGAEIEAKDKMTGNTAITFSIYFGGPEKTKLLLDHGAKPSNDLIVAIAKDYESRNK